MMRAGPQLTHSGHHRSPVHQVRKNVRARRDLAVTSKIGHSKKASTPCLHVRSLGGRPHVALAIAKPYKPTYIARVAQELGNSPGEKSET